MDKCSDSTGDSSDDEPLSKLTKKLKTDDLSKTTQSELNSQPDPRKASDDSTGDSSDDEPLSTFIKKSQTDDLSNTTQSEHNSQSHTSDDEPLKKIVRISLPVMIIAGESKGNKRGSNKTEKTAVGSPDDEPLIRHTKKAFTAAERTAPLPLKKRPVNRARKNSNVNQSRDKHADSTSDSSDDDKPLSNVVKSLKTRTRRKTPPSATRKSPRKVPNKLQRSGGIYQESWDSSDDEPFIRMTRRSPGRRGNLAKRGRRANSNRHKGNKLRKVEEEDSDDEPLIRRVKKPIKKTRAPAKKTPEKTGVSRKKSVNTKKTGTAQITCTSDQSSDDEPLMKLVKDPSKPGKKTRPVRRAASVKIQNVAIKERSRRNIKPVQYTSKGSSNDDSSDDDEPLKKMVKKPLITKTPMLELERVEDAFENYNRGSTSKICGGKEENPADELLVKVITSPPEPLGDSVAEDRGKREVNCDKEP